MVSESRHIGTRTHADARAHRHKHAHVGTCTHVHTRVPAPGLSCHEASLRQVPRVCAPVSVWPAGEEEPRLLPPHHLRHRVPLLLPSESQEHRCARRAGVPGCGWRVLWGRLWRWQCAGAPLHASGTARLRAPGARPSGLGVSTPPAPFGALGLVHRSRPTAERRRGPAPVCSPAFL